MAPLYSLRRRLGLTRQTQLTRAIDGAGVDQTGPTPGSDDHLLADRIVAAYRHAVASFPGHAESMWAQINAASAPLASQLEAGDIAGVAAALRWPSRTNLFLGFDNPVSTAENLLQNELGPGMKTRLYMQLRRLAEAVGAVRLYNPEHYSRYPGACLTVDEYLAAIDTRLGIDLKFPNPYAEEWGLVSARGIIGYRPLQAIYQAWRLTTLGANKVIEIGAGLGRTAYYARALGIAEYTIVDIPLSNVAQAHFLCTTLGVDRVSLIDEPRQAVRIVGPSFVADTQERFDVVLNVDSLTEMDKAVSAGYTAFARRSAEVFVSINHETNGTTASEMVAGARVLRMPYWMRDGYVEEIVFNRQAVFETAGLT